MYLYGRYKGRPDWELIDENITEQDVANYKSSFGNGWEWRVEDESGTNIG